MTALEPSTESDEDSHEEELNQTDLSTNSKRKRTAKMKEERSKKMRESTQGNYRLWLFSTFWITMYKRAVKFYFLQLIKAY